MSTEAGGQKLLFEGFLKKRKDTMKLRWTTYWFRLHNTTLFFYTEKHGSALHLRGQYYIYTVQSVREVKRPESKRYLFEIIMKNGKRKVLAAETADLRREWVGQLWKAMQLSGPGRSESVCAWQSPTVPELKRRAHSSPCTSSDTRETVESKHLSSTPEQQWDKNPLTNEPHTPDTAQTSLESSTSFSEAYSVTRFSTDAENEEGNADQGENYYDTLPVQKRCLVEQPQGDVIPEEGIYDTPRSNRRASDRQHECREMTESIYDVPRSLLRKMSEHTLEAHSGCERPESGGLLSDMMASLGGDSAAWEPFIG